MSEIDYKKMKGEDLFHYFTTDHPDKDYASIIQLLPYAIMDAAEGFRILERAVKKGKEFIIVYPGIESKIDTSKMEYVGSVPDGLLYLK